MENKELNSFYEDLRCPECLGKISVKNERPKCKLCGIEYQIKEGIPDLRKDRSSYYCEFPKNEIEQFLADAKKKFRRNRSKLLKR